MKATSPVFDTELFDAEVKKQYGDEALKALDAKARFGAPGTFIPTSSEALNLAIGIGGIPRGRVTEILGPESGGKTTLLLDIIANAQRADKDAFVFVNDSENALNPQYAETLGADLSGKRFRLSQTNEVEEGLNLIMKAAKFGAAIVAVDSVPTLCNEKDLDGDESTADRVGGIAKPLRSHLKKLVAVCAQTGTAAIFINHITYKVGLVFGNPETSPGGTGLPFYASLRLDVRPAAGGRIVDKTTGEVTGMRTVVTVRKNKVGTPFKKAEYDLIYGEGIDSVKDLVAVAGDVGAIEKSGNWYKFGEEKFNGAKGLEDKLRKDFKLQQQIRKALHEKLRNA